MCLCFSFSWKLLVGIMGPWFISESSKTRERLVHNWYSVNCLSCLAQYRLSLNGWWPDLFVVSLFFNKENVNMFEDKTKMPGTQWNFYELGLGPGLFSPEDPVTWKRGDWSRIPPNTSSPHALPCTCWLWSPSWSGMETVEGANVIIHLLNTYLLSTYYLWALGTQAPALRGLLEKKTM